MCIEGKKMKVKIKFSSFREENIHVAEVYSLSRFNKLTLEDLYQK